MQPSQFPGIDDQLDELVAQNEGNRANRVQPAKSRYPAIDAHLGDIQQRERAAVDSTLDLALPRNPDKAAEAQTLADRFKLDMATVQAKQDELARIARGEDIRKSLVASPILRRQMTDMKFAEIAHDDVETLSGLESAMTALKNTPRALLGGLQSASADVVGFAKMPFDLLDPVGELFSGTVLPENPIRRVAQGLGKYRQWIDDQAKASTPKGSGNIESGFYDGMASMSRNVASLPMLLLPGGQRATLTAMVAPVVGGEYSNARDAGLNPTQSLTYAASQGAIEWATEKLPVAKLLGDLKVGETFIKTLAKQALYEVPGEQVATVLQDLNTWAAIDANKGKTLKDYIADRPDAAVQTLVATLVGTGGQVSVVKAVDMTMGHMAFKEERAAAAEQHAAVLEQLGELTKASKALARSPQSVAQFVQEAAKEQGAENVYVDAKVFNQLMQDQGIKPDQIPAPLRDQLAEATARGGDVVIPVGTFVTEIASTEYGAALADHVKLDPNGESRFEAADFNATKREQFEQDVDRTLSKQETDTAWEASREAVQGQIQQELDALGRFTPEKNAADAVLFASYYATRAAQLGVTPEALYAQRGVKFAAENVGGARLDQGKNDQTGVIDEATGLPLNADGTVTVYHHTSAENATAIRESGVLKSQAEPDLYFTTTPETNTGYGDTAIAFRVKPERLLLDDEFPGGRSDYRVETKTTSKSRRVRFLPDGSAVLNQSARGAFSPESLTISMLKGADLSTVLHEGAHFFFENDIALAADLLKTSFDAESMTAGEAQIVADVSALMNFHGITGTIQEQLAQWYTMDFEQQRTAHERTAESFEAYMFAGESPSVELAPYFQRFREWMLSVYKSLKDFIAKNPEAGKLDDTVRGIFDRMLATKEQIEIAQQARSMMPLFESAEQAGYTAQEFQAYQEMARQSSDVAADELQARAMRDMAYSRNAHGREVKRLQKESAELRSEMRIEARRQVMGQPVYQAWSYITATQQEGEKGTNKLFLSPNEANISPEQVAVLKARKMLSKNGMHPDIAIDMIPGINTEFANGDQLVRALAQATDINEAIDNLTDKMMLEQHGELASPEAIERSADLAIHNEVRARLVASELNAINRMSGKPKILATAAKAYAGKIVNRLMLANVKPHLYAAAKARAARASEKAFKSGNLEQASVEKRNELINAYAAVAAKQALAEARATVKYFKSLTKGSDKKTVQRGMDPDVLNAARFILGAYGVGEKSAERAADYLDVLRRNNPEMSKVLEPSIQATLANARPLEQLTIEELRGLREEIEAMAHLAKRSRMLEVGGNLLDREEVVTELDAKLEEIGVPEVIPGEKSAITPMEKAKSSLQYAGAILRRVEQWAEAKDGKFGGPFLRYVFQPVKEAADRYRTDRSKYRKAYLELVKGIAPSMRTGLIEAPELGYTFGKGHNGVAMAELLHAILHTGNESNKRKLLLGRGWAVDLGEGQMDTGRWDAFIQRLHDTGVLKKVHYDFAQGVWDLLDSMKPAAQKTHRDVFGMYFEEVTANEFNTPFGTYRGGYVPAQADPQIVKDASMRELAEQDNQSMAYSFPTTSKGFTKARVEYNRPLKLDLRSLSQHIDKVLLFTHMEPAVRDVNRVLTDKGFSGKLARVDPAAIDGMLAPWLKRSATQQVETPITGDGGVSRVLSTIRSRAGMALMFGNISNTMQQITGLPGAANKVKPGLLAKATASYMASPKAMANNVAEASIFMRDRMTNEVAAIHNQMSEILLDPSYLERGQAWTMKHAYFLQSAFDNVIGPIVWTGAYNQAMQEGMPDVEAVRFADGVVRQTQGTTLPEDVSRIETGPAYARLFTQFLGYFNMLANTNATELKKVMREVGIRKGATKMSGIVFFGLLAPAWIAEAMAIAMRGGPSDDDDDGYLDDWLMQVAGLGTVKFALAGIPFVGQFVNAGINRWNGNPVDDRVSLSPGVSLAEGAVGAPYSVYQAIVNDGKTSKAVKDVATAVTLMTGLPVHWAARPISYLTGIAEDRIEPEGPVDAIRGIATGTASPDSRR